MAARAFVLETQDALPEGEHFWPAYLACAHAAQATRHAVGIMNNTAGTTGSRMDSPRAQAS